MSSVEPPPTSTIIVSGGSSRPAVTPRKVQLRLLVAAQEAGREAVAPFDLAEEGLAVLGVAHSAGPDGQGLLCAELVEDAPVLAERVADAGDGGGEEEPPRVDAFAEAGDHEPPLHLTDGAVLDVGHEQARRVRPQVDGADARHFLR